MKWTPSNRVGAVLVVCFIASVLASVLNGFIQNLGEHLAAQDAEPARTTAMVRPSDGHVSSYVPPVAAEQETAEPQETLGTEPTLSQKAPKLEPAKEIEESRPRWFLWFPKVVVSKEESYQPIGGGVGYRSESPTQVSRESETAYGSGAPSPGESDPEAEGFGSCVGGSGSTEELVRGITSTPAGSSTPTGTFSELNDFRGIAESAGAATAGSGGSEAPVPLGGAGYRGQYFSAEIHLTAQEGTGLYEFAVFADQRVRLETQIASDRWETLVQGETSGGEQLFCGTRMVRLHRYTWAPIRVTVSDPSRAGGQTLALFWRRVEERSLGTDPLCGTSTALAGGPGPSASWSAFFRRGWSVVPARVFYVPGTMQSAGCPQGAAALSTPDTVSFGTVEGDTWTCTGGVRAARVGGQIVIDFGEASCAGADSSRAVPGMSSCWLTPPAGVDAQALVDRIQTSGSMRVRAVTGAECADVRELQF
jgi:hypothetical protein